MTMRYPTRAYQNDQRRPRVLDGRPILQVNHQSRQTKSSNEKSYFDLS